ncbi:MAG: hypothetical protein KDC44_04590, partial [Phaeodactylibacter sp.]|nr:hypothetical protein [Phaeodactylibacter sp.]
MLQKIRQTLSRYRQLPQAVLLMIAAEFCVQGMNTAFFLLLNYYMVEEGYADYEVARVISLRFMAVGLLAFPLGLFIKGRRLKPFFLFASLLVPLCSLVVIYAVDYQMNLLLNVATFVWGIGFMCMQITALPFILLNAPRDLHSEGISLSYLAFGTMICLIGISYSLLNWLSPAFFNERNVLYGISVLALAGVYFSLRVRIPENRSERIPLR